MLDMYTSNGKYAFQFDELEELAEKQEDYGLDPDLDLNDLGRTRGECVGGHGEVRERRVVSTKSS